MLRPWRWMYAQLYNWNVRKWGRRRDPDVFSLGALSTVTSAHIVTILRAYEAITRTHILISRERVIAICAGLGLTHYLRFVRRGDANPMIAELELHDEAETRSDFRKLGAYALVSFALVLLASVAMALATKQLPVAG